MKGRKILFILRDGALMEPGVAEDAAPAPPIPAPGVIAALQRFLGAGYALVAIANDAPAAGPAILDRDALARRIFASQNIDFEAWLTCPHDEAAGCDCRPPGLGLVRAYLADRGLDRTRSAVAAAGDAGLALAANMGLTGLSIGQPDADHPSGQSWPNAAHALLDAPRTARVGRRTRETDISIEVDLDRAAEPKVATGIGFFDHMLEQLGKHGGFALTIRSTGDLEVDEHHTVEDVALALGEALAQALDDKRGIGRYGFVLPMDEAEAAVALDLSGRPYFVFEGEFPRDRVGTLPTELVPHFFRSLSDALGATLHVRVHGENAHHMVEACFKGVARTMRQAFSRSGDELPTTKGTL